MEKEFDLQTVFDIIKNEIDAVYILDYDNDHYKTLKSNKVFDELFGKEGRYFDLSRKLIFSFYEKNANVDEAYDVFLKNHNHFCEKYSRKRKIYLDDKAIDIQMTVYPLTGTNKSVLLITELGSDNYFYELLDKDKDSAISSTYLFSMYVDLNSDLCSSVSITELADSPLNNTRIKYSGWRKDIVNMMYPDDKATFLKYTDPIYIRNNLKVSRPLSVEAQMMNLEGKYIWVKLTFKRIATANENDFRFVFMVQDIHESYMKIQEDIKRYEELSNRDSLTGVYNRGKIEHELCESIKKCKNSEQSVSLFMFDIDYFKNVNDIHGHATGDYVLKTLMVVVKKFLEDYNIQLGRWGGEEFIGICYDMPKNDLYELTQKLRERISEYNFENVGRLTCSFGITEIFENEEATDVFDRLDKALYNAKESGRDCVICA